VVAWLGYDAPEGAEVAWDSRADGGGAALARFVKGFGKGKRVTVSGHSYGSLVAAKAVADNGARPDNLIFVGSPGVLQSSAAAFAPTRVWVGATKDDPVVIGARRLGPMDPDPHGPNPAAGRFGGFRFHTDGAHGHSQYYKQNESGKNVAKIIAGQYCKVSILRAPQGFEMGCRAADR
jgi:pimeloyl-ACP methyl ester carboxylesterase